MLLVFWSSHSLHDSFCFGALGFRLFDGSGFEGMPMLVVLSVSLFDPMTLKPGSAASRSVNNLHLGAIWLMYCCCAIFVMTLGISGIPDPLKELCSLEFRRFSGGIPEIGRASCRERV